MDQGEELARTEGESGDALADLLRSALAAPPKDGEPVPWLVCFTVRTDSFQELQAAERFRGIPTRPADIRSLPIFRFCHAIEQPAGRYGVEVEPRLVDALIEDASGSDALPLLAFTLQRLWRQFAPEKRIRLASYADTGKLHGLIEDAAERALRGLDPSATQGPLEGDLPPGSAQDRAAAGVFVPALAQLNERGAAIRRVAPYQDFDEAARKIIAHFDKWRLVVRSGSTVEVAHEAMFRVWPRFQTWLAPEKARLEALRSLESAAAAWSAKGQSQHELIHRGRRLAEASALARFDHYKRQVERNPEAGAYLAACRAAAHRRRMLAATAALALLVVAGGMYLLAIVQPNIAALAKTQIETDECLFGFCDARSISLADKLRRDYAAVKGRLTGDPSNEGTIDFSAANSDVQSLFAIDADNGHALYYSEEIARVSNPRLFDPLSCIKPPSGAGRLVLEGYEASFFRYLEASRTLPASETGGSMAASACSNRARGYCPQRTAWIYHLLANDLYAEAQATSDLQDQATKSHNARFYAEMAMELYSEPGQAKGFTQCTATETLAKKAIELERAADKKVLSGSP